MYQEFYRSVTINDHLHLLFLNYTISIASPYVKNLYFSLIAMS